MFLIFISDDAYTLKCSPEKVENYDIGNAVVKKNLHVFWAMHLCVNELNNMGIHQTSTKWIDLLRRRHNLHE